VVGNCARQPKREASSVGCIPPVYRLVVGERSGGFAEAPVHNRMVGQDHLPVVERVGILVGDVPVKSLGQYGLPELAL
jgi:hypothetical protein